jgi:hypothetical protein
MIWLHSINKKSHGISHDFILKKQLIKLTTFLVDVGCVA